MKSLISTLTQKTTLSALRDTTILLIVVAIAQFITYKLIDARFYTETVAREAADPNGPISNETNAFFAAISIYGFISLIVAIVSVVVTYKIIVNRLHKSKLNARSFSTTTATIFTLAGLVSGIIGYMLPFIFKPNSFTPPENSSTNSVIIGDLVAASVVLVIAVALFFTVRHFAYKRAVREQEELFS